MKQKTEVLKTTLIIGLVGSLAFSTTKDINKTTPAEQYEKLESSMTVHENMFKSIENDILKREELTEEHIKELQKQIEAERLKQEQERLKTAVGTIGYSLGLSEADVNLLNRLVEAEAGSEPYAGKIAVVNVVLNRMKSSKFPNNIYDVIYQPNQFEVVNIGTINTKIPTEETKKAVKDALNGAKAVNDNITMFWAKYLDKTHPIWSHCSINTTIGNHHFSDNWK